MCFLASTSATAACKAAAGGAAATARGGSPVGGAIEWRRCAVLQAGSGCLMVSQSGGWRARKRRAEGARLAFSEPATSSTRAAERSGRRSNERSGLLALTAAAAACRARCGSCGGGACFVQLHSHINCRALVNHVAPQQLVTHVFALVSRVTFALRAHYSRPAVDAER